MPWNDALKYAAISAVAQALVLGLLAASGVRAPVAYIATGFAVQVAVNHYL